MRRVCVCVHTCTTGRALRVKKGRRREGEEKACVLSFTRERIQLLNKTSLSLSPFRISGLYCSVCVRSILSLLLSSLSPLQDNTPLAAPPMSFVTIKKLECL